MRSKPTLESLDWDTKLAANFFATHPDSQALPWMALFPTNSCERSAVLLALALASKYPKADIRYVEGSWQSGVEQHYWVEVDDIVVDPTAHQFSGFSKPLVCSSPHPLECKFHVTNKRSLNGNAPGDLADNDNWAPALAALRDEICDAAGAT